MGTTPPSAARATTGTGGSGGGLVHFTPTPKKETRGNHTHLQQCAPPPVLEQVDGRPRPVFERIGGRHRSRESNHHLRGERRMRYHWNSRLLRGTGTQHTDQTHTTHQCTHRPHMQAPWRCPPPSILVWLYVDLHKSQYPLGFLNPKDLKAQGRWQWPTRVTSDRPTPHDLVNPKHGYVAERGQRKQACQWNAGRQSGTH